MANKCFLCNDVIEEEYNKLKGTIIKIKDKNNKNSFRYVCNECQKKPDWINSAKKAG